MQDFEHQPKDPNSNHHGGLGLRDGCGPAIDEHLCLVLVRTVKGVLG